MKPVPACVVPLVSLVALGLLLSLRLPAATLGRAQSSALSPAPPISSGTGSPAALAVSGTGGETGAEEIEVEAEGMAALTDDLPGAEEEAVWDAKRNAVEQAVGVLLRSRAIGRDFAIETDEIQGRSAGFVRRWEKIPGSRRLETVRGANANGGANAQTGPAQILHVRIRAAIALTSVIRRLADIADVYADLERPRVCVRITARSHADDASAQRAQDALIAALKTQGFEVAQNRASSEATILGQIAMTPTVRMGDASAPYGVGESVAASRADCTLQIVSEASEEILLTTRIQGQGQSFHSDQEAGQDAAADAITALTQTGAQDFANHLLARWTRERQEGHAVALRVTGLDAARQLALRERVAEMRGFRKFLPEGGAGASQPFTLRFLTRLDNRALRRRLTALGQSNPSALALTVLNARGSLIQCAATAKLR